MIDRLRKSIEYSFHNSIELLIEICESEIEQIFLLKIIDFVAKRFDDYSLGFIVEETDTIEIEDKGYINAKVNYNSPGGFGYLCGLSIKHISSPSIIEIYPQKEVSVPNPDNLSHIFKYRLDFGIFKYQNSVSKVLVSKYCIECDGHEFHSTKDQIKKDNKRMRQLLLQEGYSSIRYSGSEVFNMSENDIGMFLMGLIK